jgi:DNA-binding response OmpR family regulator
VPPGLRTGFVTHILLIEDDAGTAHEIMLELRANGYTFEPNSNVVDVHMGRLRRKVDGEGEPQLIRNVRGQGYVFDVPV